MNTHEMLEAARARETGKAFVTEYRRRAGIEGTSSQGVRAMHLRRARYVGLAKTRLRHVLTAAAMNLSRLGSWLAATLRARTPIRLRSAYGNTSPHLTTSPAVSEPGQSHSQKAISPKRLRACEMLLLPTTLNASALHDLACFGSTWAIDA